MSDKHSLYFIALLPPHDKLKSIQNIKELYRILIIANTP